MTAGPDFSVVIPTWNRAGHVGPCLRPFLAPEARGLDVIVADDGSTDETEARVLEAAGQSRGADIRYLRQANSGPGAARNLGVAQARHDWVLFLDVDDRWFDWSVGHVRAALADAGGAGLLFLAVHRFAEDAELGGVVGGPSRLVRHPGFAEAWLASPQALFGSCNVGIRRDLYGAAGGFEPALRGHEDYDLFCRLSGPVMRLEAPAIVGYRDGGVGSLTGNSRGMLDGMLFLLKGLETGRYAMDPALMRRILALKCRSWVHIFFARGDAAEAYALLRAAQALMAAELGRAAVLRLAATPALSLAGAGNYRFGWDRFRARP